MLRIDQLRLLPDQPESDLTAKCARLLRTDPSSLRDLTVRILHSRLFTK